METFRALVADRLPSTTAHPEKRNALSAASIVLSSNVVQICICFLGGICCFLPMFMSTVPYLEDIALAGSLTSATYLRDSSVASLVLALPILLDLALDATASFSIGRRITVKRHSLCLNNVEKLMMVIGINSVPLISFLSSSFSNLALLFICCKKFQPVIVGGTIMISLCRYDKKFWSASGTILFLAVSISAGVTSAFVENHIMKNPSANYLSNLELATNIFNSAPLLYLVNGSIRWLAIVIIPKYWPKKYSKDPVVGAGQADNHVYFMMVWVLTSLVGILLLSANAVAYGNHKSFDGIALTMHNLAFLCFELCIVVLLMRIVKCEVVEGLSALIASKKSYVRYISHELRTPLNTVFLGLEHLTDNLKSSTCPDDVDRYDTICQVNISCQVALDILNDLLCFDKLESGILELHKHEVLVIPFITDCVAMFHAHSEELGITMVVRYPSNSSDENEGYRTASLSMNEDGYMKSSIEKSSSVYHPIKGTDSVVMDKLKMNQVVRNLISNALKFTQKGGSITVTVAFRTTPYMTRTDTKIKTAPEQSKKATSAFTLQSTQIYSCEDDMEQQLHPCDRNLMNKGCLVITVADTGVGISPSNQKRLFKDIVQFNPEILQAGEGSGLGLWIAKGIVDLHYGKISVHSEGENKGATFTVEIPMSLDTNLECHTTAEGSNFPSMRAPPTDQYSNDLPSFASHNSARNLRDPITFGLTRDPSESFIIKVPEEPKYYLLIVDDSHLNRKMLCKILRGAGHTCDEAQDGEFAIAEVNNNMLQAETGQGRIYDAVLMDFMMPNISGPEATRIMCELGFPSPVLGVTGNALDSDIQYFLDCGAAKVFTKPLDIAALKRFMSRTLLPTF